MLEVLLGEQRPRLARRPESAVASYGDMVVDFVRACGMRLDDWQEYVLWALHDVDEKDRWAASEAGLLVSRQQGKTEILVAFDLARLFLFPMEDLRRRTVLHTAHEVKTATESFEALKSIIESQPRLEPLVDHIYSANGKEAIVLKKRRGQRLGDRVRFVARSKGSGRGFAAADIVYDEAQYLTHSQRSALSYTTTTIPNRQQLYFGTVPDDGEGEVFEGVRDRGRTGPAPRTMWMEWSPEGAEDPKLTASIDLHDPMVWAQSLPALGIRVEPETIQEQVDTATDRGELLRERFSVWPNRPEVEEVALSALDLKAWDDHKVENREHGKGAAIALALGGGGQFASIGIASQTEDGRVYVEHRHTAAGTLWLADFVAVLKKQMPDALVVLDPKNAAMVLTALGRRNVRYMAMSLDELAAAHSQFIEHVNAGRVEHRGQAEVRKSLQYATTRVIGKAGSTWEASDPRYPIAQAQVVTWALWGVFKLAANPPRDPAKVKGYA
ncbi:hypothetical protein [Microcella frigidaquae]|uniref:Phage terminase-like protein, large subunit, contains N-terminal HTH domain n=1 Tax=Microcella frigidaquae TaxID=424758 RepID=A0A840X497_9MICO|nr:hypothetical protein [Microcella frigidaquae]MBB5617210.1 hypothetical protein [Microcella frigidaquae]NHN45089.1 hypothetical protein [Microcella frigidaquae]